MDIKIWIADTRAATEANQLDSLLSELPSLMHDRARRYRFAEDAYAFVVGRILLKKALEEMGKGHLIEKILIAKNGKPYLNEVFFNISHSASKVVCALSTKGPLGIDIERIKPVDLENFTAFFTKKEMHDIQNHPEPLTELYRYWTRKESIIKATGKKLAYLNQIKIDLNQVFFYENGKKWFVQELNFGDGFMGSLCTGFVVDVSTCFRVIQRGIVLKTVYTKLRDN